MQGVVSQFSLQSYQYDLPEERIAQSPPEQRGQSRLMVLDRQALGSPAWLTHTVFDELPSFLPKNALLVVNNSRVVPARLSGTRATGGKAELLLLTPPPLLEKSAQSGLDGCQYALAEVLLKPGKHIHVGDRLSFGPLGVEVLEKKEFGRHDVRLFWKGSLTDLLEQCGHIPLPPYIRRQAGTEDQNRYQTLYADRNKAGSVAAPTAGLHFTQSMRDRLHSLGFGWAEITLHVGYGTFSPVREEDIRKHRMHSEYVEIPATTARAVNEAKAEGRPVLAVGTTSARTLEGCARQWKQNNGFLPSDGWSGWTDIFICPGYRFAVVDGLITNFHLPGSSLLMLVSALAGRESILEAYHQAVEQKYRFFSYGDAMLVR